MIVKLHYFDEQQLSEYLSESYINLSQIHLETDYSLNI